MISVIIVTYFHEKFIKKTIESVLMQKLSVPYEIIVSDDHSSDATLDIVKNYCDKVTLVTHEEHVGIARNFYDGIKSAKGDYFSIVAGDDWLITDDYLQKHYDYLIEHKECAAVAHYTVLFNENDQMIKRLSYPTENQTLDRFLLGHETCMHYGMVKNIFKRDGIEWLYKATPYTDEVTFLFYILMNGDWGMLPEYCYAHRCIVGEESKNYNSTFDVIDNFVNIRQGFRYIEKNVTADYSFDCIINKYGSKAVKSAYGDLIKRHNKESLRKLRQETNFSERVKYILFYLLKLKE